MISINTLLAQGAVERQIYLSRLSASVRNEVMKILKRIERQMAAALAEADLTDYKSARYKAMVRSVGKFTEEAFLEAEELSMTAMKGVVGYELKGLRGDVRTYLGVDLLNANLNAEWVTNVATNVMTMGATTEEWWSRMSDETVFKFERTVRQGMVAGETTDQIIKRVRGTEGIASQTRAQTAALVQTAISTSANDARLEMLKANGDIVKGIQQISTLDERTTDICMAYDGATWDLDGEPIGDTDLPFNGGPPRHWNCRSTIVPILFSSEELGTGVEIAPGKRASMDGAVSDKMTFGDWLETRSAEQQDEILGEGRADLWREGKITLRDLLDQSGRPLTLGQIRSRLN